MIHIELQLSRCTTACTSSLGCFRRACGASWLLNVRMGSPRGRRPPARADTAPSDAGQRELLADKKPPCTLRGVAGRGERPERAAAERAAGGPPYTGIYPGPFSHTGYFGFGHPSSRRRVWRDCRGSAATSRATPRATHARARVLEFAPLGATRLKADARDAPPFLVIGKAPVRTALGPARRAVALGGRRGVGVLHKYRYIPSI